MEYGPRDVAVDLDAVRVGGAKFDVQARLEHLFLQTMKQDGLSGLAKLLRSVPGYTVRQHEPGASEDEAWYSCLGGSGPELVVHACASPDLDFIDITTGDEPAQGAKADPGQGRFYDTWESMLGLDDAAVADLDTPRKAVFLIGLLEAEVMNGGLGQYLTNTEGVHLDSTLRLLDEIGATRTLGILVQAVSLGSEAESFVAAWDSKSKEFSALDDEFLAAAEDLAGLTASTFLGSEGNENPV